MRLVLIAVLMAGGVAFQVAARRGERQPADPAARRAVLFAAAVWLAALPVCLWLRLRAPAGEQGWTRFPYLDKRWLLLLFEATVVAVLWLPPIFAWLARGRDRVAHLARGTDELAPRTRGVLAKLAVALLVSTLLFGPPWNLAWSERAINPHESLQWSGLQAIHEGRMPYVGPASVNYGPGSQLATFLYMKASGGLTVSGFREAHAVCVWAAAFLASAAALLVLPALAACVAILALVLVPLSGWTWTPAGVFDSTCAWTNPLRHIGPLLLCLGMYALVARQRSVKGPAIALGAVWGLVAYFAQENLLGGLVVLCALLAVAVAGGRLSLRAGVTVLAGLALGFLCVALPILAIYGRAGELAHFVHNYFLVPGRFMRGYANTWYTGALASEPWAVAFYALPVLALAAGMAAVHRVRPLGPVAQLSKERFLVLSAASAFLAAYPSALTRSDPAHFERTTFAVPLLVALACFVLPRILQPDRARARMVLSGFAAVLAVLTFLPHASGAPRRLLEIARGRWSSFALATRTLPPPAGPGETERRFGPILAATEQARATIQLYAHLKKRVGDDPTLVFVDVPAPLLPSSDYVYDGFLYFMADLVPGPTLMERSDVVADMDDLALYLAHLEAHATDFDWIVSLAPTSPEIELFQSAHPAWGMEVLEQGDTQLYLIGAARGPSTLTPAAARAEVQGYIAAVARERAAVEQRLARLASNPERARAARAGLERQGRDLAHFQTDLETRLARLAPPQGDP